MRKKFIYILLVGIILILSFFLTNSTFKNEDNHIDTTLSTNEDIPSEITLDNGNGERFIVPISSIPDLESYLESETDIKTELERIQVEFLNWDISNDHDYYFILKYGCGNKFCNLVLVQITELNEVTTTYLAEGIFTGSKAFEEKAMFRIAENEGNAVLRHQIIIVDLNTMIFLHPTDINNDENYFISPIYPITEFKWISPDSIELVIADIPDSTYESIEKWYKATSALVKDVMITIK